MSDEIKIYYLSKFPKNAKISSSDVISIRKINFDINTNEDLYVRLIAEIQKEFEDVISVKEKIETYFKDDEDELVTFNRSSQIFSQIRNNNNSNKLKIYIRSIESTIKSSEDPTSKFIGDIEDNQHKEVIPTSNKLLHIGVICDGCRGSIIGKRFKCNLCEDYDLCESCCKKNVHTDHTDNFKKISPTKTFFEGFFCDICFKKDLDNLVHLCKTCSKNVFDNKNCFVICTECNSKRSHPPAHILIEYKAENFIRKRQMQISEIEKNHRLGTKTEAFRGIPCGICNTDGVSFISSSFWSAGVTICENCLCRTIIDCEKLTSSEAETIRNHLKLMKLQLQMQEINLHNQIIENAEIENTMVFITSRSFKF